MSAAEPERKKKKFKRNPPGGGGALTRYQINAIEKIYDSVPHSELVEALQHSPDARADRLLKVMSDPAYTQHSFALKCKAADIPPAEVWRLVINLHKLDGEIRMARRLPEVMQSLADDALPRTMRCPGCNGTGVTVVQRKGEDVERPCAKCFGQGKLLVPADAEARKLVLEAAGIVGQRGPLIDARQVHMGGGPGGGGGFSAPDMSDWSRATDDIYEERGAYRRTVSTVVEASVVSIEE